MEDSLSLIPRDMDQRKDIPMSDTQGGKKRRTSIEEEEDGKVCFSFPLPFCRRLFSSFFFIVLIPPSTFSSLREEAFLNQSSSAFPCSLVPLPFSILRGSTPFESETDSFLSPRALSLYPPHHPISSDSFSRVGGNYPDNSSYFHPIIGSPSRPIAFSCA